MMIFFFPLMKSRIFFSGSGKVNPSLRTAASSRNSETYVKPTPDVITPISESILPVT